MQITPDQSLLRQRWYVLGVLWLVAVLRFVDLQILVVLLEPIKREFMLSDTQLALLTGLAFALFYGLLGIPAAWLAERWHRARLIAVAITLWSAMTALCGQATGFLTLFLARMGVGVGEAGAYPPSTSLLADYFPARQRGLAHAVLASAIPAGVFCGFIVGSFVSHWLGWRAALQVVGLPGILLGLLLWFSIADPRQHQSSTRQHGAVRQSVGDLWQTCKQLWRQPAYRTVVAAACLFTTGAMGSGVWMPSFFIRQHGMASVEVGVWMAVLYGGGGLLGALTGGWLAGRLDREGTGGAFARISQWSLLLTLPLLPFILLSSNAAVGLLALGGMTFLMHMNSGPVLHLLQVTGGHDRRALAHAFSVLVSNLVALPLGPLLVAGISDTWSTQVGPQALGWGILVVLGMTWSAAAWLFGAAAASLRKPALSASEAADQRQLTLEPTA